MKIAFGMIIFEGDYVLHQCLEQVYPFATQILIAEGPVSYWQNRGRMTSLDHTNEILDNFPDPENKIKIVHGQYSEKDHQCRSYMPFIRDDIDYLWNLDSDEIYKTEDLEKMIQFLVDEQPTSIGIQSCTFYGGFDDVLTGFELKTDNFLRVFKYIPGANWLTHRPPTLAYPHEISRKHINSLQLFQKLNVQMYHYSYVFPRQVFQKVNYYKDAITKENCISNYFSEVYLPWVLGNVDQRKIIESLYKGVHEFIPEFRGDCFTTKFTGTHPESITKNLDALKYKFDRQLDDYSFIC